MNAPAWQRLFQWQDALVHPVTVGAVVGIGLLLGLMANDSLYRPVLILILLSVELNDVFAYCTGKILAGRKILPNTSPGKTVADSLGALVLTTGLVAWVGRTLFAGTTMARAEIVALQRQWEGVGIPFVPSYGALRAR